MSDVRPAPRTRTRNMELGTSPAPKPEQHVTPFMKELATTMFAENNAKNAAARAYDTARKTLFAGMCNASPPIRSFDMTGINDKGEKIELVVAIDAPQSEGMDVRKLWNLLGAGNSKEAFDKFMDTVSASKKAVEDNHGKAMAARIAYVKIGDENVSVKPKDK